MEKIRRKDTGRYKKQMFFKLINPKYRTKKIQKNYEKMSNNLQAIVNFLKDIEKIKEGSKVKLTAKIYAELLRANNKINDL